MRWMRQTRWVVILALACVATQDGLTAQSEPQRQDRGCPALPGGLVTISLDSIGYLPTRASFEELRILCPSARDTATGGYDLYVMRRGLIFEIESVTAMAVESYPIEPVKKPGHWIVMGSGGVLPNGVRLNATWRDLRSAYGTAFGTTEAGPALVTFCDVLDFTFELDVHRFEVGSIEATNDLSTIPDDAGIRLVLVGGVVDPPLNVCQGRE